MKQFTRCGMPVLLIITSCYSTYNLPVNALYKLDGYRADENRPMQDTAGHIHEFNQTKSLKVQLTNGSQVVRKFSAIDISDTILTGRAQDGPIKINLLQVRTAKLREPSVGKAVGLGLGIGIPLLIVGAWASVILPLVLAVDHNHL